MAVRRFVLEPLREIAPDAVPHRDDRAGLVAMMLVRPDPRGRAAYSFKTQACP